MIVRNLRDETGDGVARVAADVLWEDTSRPDRTIFFEVPAQFGPLEVRPEAFLVAVAVPAMEHGERRIRVEGSVCPRLVANLTRALALLQTWFPDAYTVGPPAIECPEREPSASLPLPRRHRALFVSGGADSLGVLALNVASHAHGTPERVRTGIFVHGFDIGGEDEKPQNRAFFDGYSSRLRDVVAHVGVELIPVSTNLKLLEEDWGVWSYRFFGAGLAAVGHALWPRITDVGIAASLQDGRLVPIGSHPDLDPLFSDSRLRVTHEDSASSRGERITRVAAWPEALAVLRVCWSSDHPPETPNCGHCIKCVRAMAILEALGVLELATAFPVRALTRAHIATTPIRAAVLLPLVPELQAFLRDHGRDDLAAGFDDAIADYHRWLPWKDAPPPPRWRAMLRSADDRLTGGAVRSLLRRVRPARPPRG